MGLKELVGRLIGKSPSTHSDADLTSELLEDSKTIQGYWYGQLDLSKFATYEKIKALPAEQKASLALSVAHQLHSIRAKPWPIGRSYDSDGQRKANVLENLLSALLKMSASFTGEQIVELIELFQKGAGGKNPRASFTSWPVGYASIQLEKHIKQHGLSERTRVFLQRAVEWKEFDQTSGYWGSDVSKAKLRLQKLLFDNSDDAGEVQPFVLKGSDVLTEPLNAAIKTLDPELRNRFYEMCHLAVTASGSKPSKKYADQSKEILSRTNIPAYKELLRSALELLIDSKEQEETTTHRWQGGEFTYTHRTFLCGKNPDLAKGLVWSLAQFHDEATLDVVARLAERSFRKIPGQGPTCAGVGNSCLYTLASSKGLLGMSHLSRLKLRITQNNTRKLIQKYIDEGAARLGISSSELEEIAVPDFGLIAGVREEDLDGYTLRLSITGVGKTHLEWITPEGKPQKSAPAAVTKLKKNSDKINRIKAIAKQVQKYVSAQRDRIDRSYIEDRVWKYEAFSKYYLDHGLVSFVARKLVWELSRDEDSVLGIWRDGAWQDVLGNPIADPDDSTVIRLWHPMTSEPSEVVAWRDRLETLQIQQPLKQAYREVYILTEAELNTRSYSNRMAAHIIKQHQFNSLGGVRGWKYQLLGAYDHGRDGAQAIIQIPAHGIQCEFWINELYSEDGFNDAGIWNYVGTDQVRFLGGGGNVMNLVDVPRIVFSEMMRDVDLFVGVCSVANDPAWQDSGEGTRHRDYWQSHSFGDLTEVAKTRKLVLERLIPRMKIRDRARIDGKFLRVQGKLREYKIHIGSTNILMEPNDQYLCIVAGRSEAALPGNVFLPFEGDRGLSMVLSKALLLADDDKITDPTIVSQIRPRK